MLIKIKQLVWKKLENYLIKKGMIENQKILEGKEIENLTLKYDKVKKIIYFSTPNHGNLGDHAIAIGVENIIKTLFQDLLCLEFSIFEYNRNKDLLEKLVNQEDIIIITGGGNFGNLWLTEENQRRDIVRRFSNNKIIVMPQSISFTNDEEGAKELKISQSIYSQHKNFNIITRDNKSYQYGIEYFPNNKVFLAPDSVLYLEDWYKRENQRDGVILTLRSDKEKSLSNEKIDKIISFLENKNIVYKRDDTVKNYGIDRKIREYEVKEMLRKISSAKVNITDRFHGVIFSVITNTPVIAFKSLDHKIEEGIKWFKYLDWVHYVTTVEEVESLVEKYVNSQEIIKREKFILKEKLESVMREVDKNN